MCFCNNLFITMLIEIKSLSSIQSRVVVKELGGKKHLKSLPCGCKSTYRLVKLVGLIRVVKRLDSTIYLETVTKDRFKLN